MTTSVGIDVAKEVHWVCAIDSGGKVVLNRNFSTPQKTASNSSRVLRAAPQRVA